MHTLCYDYTTRPFPRFPAPSFWLQHRYRHHPMYFRGQRKKNVTSLSLTVLSKPNDCRDLLWIFSSFCLGFLPADGPADARFMWGDLRSTHDPATWDHFVNLILAVALISCVYMCVRVRVCSEGNTQLNRRWIFTVYSHTSNHFTHPPFFVSL